MNRLLNLSSMDKWYNRPSATGWKRGDVMSSTHCRLTGKEGDGRGALSKCADGRVHRAVIGHVCEGKRRDVWSSTRCVSSVPLQGMPRRLWGPTRVRQLEIINMYPVHCSPLV